MMDKRILNGEIEHPQYDEYKEERVGILDEVRRRDRCALESNPRELEGTIMDTMDAMMDELVKYYKNGGK